MSEPYTHRAILGWISEFITRRLPGEWPQIPHLSRTDHRAMCPSVPESRDLFYIDGGLLYSDEPNPTRYLETMTPENRALYGKTIAQFAREFVGLAPRVGETAKAELTQRCFQTILEDVEK